MTSRDLISARGLAEGLAALPAAAAVLYTPVASNSHGTKLHFAEQPRGTTLCTIQTNLNFFSQLQRCNLHASQFSSQPHSHTSVLRALPGCPRCSLLWRCVRVARPAPSKARRPNSYVTRSCSRCRHQLALR